MGWEDEDNKLGAAVSPTDTSGKDSTLPLVTSKTPALLRIGISKAELRQKSKSHIHTM